jgi:hypothetical protein
LRLYSCLDHIKRKDGGPCHNPREASTQQHFHGRLSVRVIGHFPVLFHPFVRPEAFFVSQVHRSVSRICSLESISHSISHAGDSTAIIQAPHSISSPNLPCDRPGVHILLSRDLCAALNELSWGGDDEAGQATCSAGEPYLRVRRREVCRRGRIDEGKRAVVGHEEKRVESAISKDRTGRAYAGTSS